MKRAVVCILVLLLILSGCNTNTPPETTPETENPGTTVATQPPVVLYQPGSELEQQTKGALRTYLPQNGDILGFTFLENDVILFTGSEAGTEITRFDGFDGTVLASAALNIPVDPYGGSVVTAENRITYYDPVQNACVILDGSFREVNTVVMPEGCSDVPLITGDLKTAYCTIGTEIRAVDLGTEIPRLVAQTNNRNMDLHQLVLSDSVLCCHVTDDHGVEKKVFVSGMDGRFLGEEENLISIASWGDSYLARYQDGPYLESVLGLGDGTMYNVIPEAEYHTLVPLPDANALAEIRFSEAQSLLFLYDMEKGNCLGSLELQAGRILWPQSKGDSSVWFVLEEPESGIGVLCRWDYSEALGKDSTIRIGKRNSREHPDAAGLEQCRAQAEAMSEQYGVSILLHDDAVVAENYRFTEEYQVPAIRRALEALDSAMSRFPEGFFKTAAKVSNNRKITVSLIRDFTAVERSAPADLRGLTYWIDGSVYIALTVGDHTERDFYNEMSHALDTYVFSKSIHYDFWNNCNPDGFAYFENYTDYLSVGDSPWLQPETRAFLDAYSMSYASEDRATVLEYAMMPGNEDYFSSEVMQAKLKQLCMGIREAFGWKKSEAVYPWEQYLQESLAYVKKK